MRNYFYFLFILFFAIGAKANDTSTTALLVKQIIAYKTSKATEVYLVWTMDNWKIPEAKYQPAGTYVKNGMAYTKMSGNKDSFFIHLNLPAKTYIDFMFWASKDQKGEAAEGWDNAWGQNYNYYVGEEPKVKICGDEKLAFVVKEPVKKRKPDFSVLKEGKSVLYVSSAFLIIVFLSQYFKTKRLKFNGFPFNYFLIGLLISSFLIMLLVRLQMNEVLFEKQFLLFGVSFYDMLFVSSFTLFGMALLQVTKKYSFLQNSLKGLFVVLLISFLLFSLINIEIVRQLGKPINYTWLYYSDFLKATDAKNAISNSVSNGFITNLILIVSGVIVTAYALALIISRNIYTKRRFILLSILPMLFLITGYLELKQNNFDKNKIENPVYVLAASWINTESKPPLFTMNVSQKAKNDIAIMHQQEPYEKLAGTDSINNIVLFVMESTPANLVQVYDSTYKVTPHLNEWKKSAVVYKNIYTHLPNTANAIFSIMSGSYPMISYKAIVNENPNVSVPALPQLLKDKGWGTCLFFSSDLTYSNIGNYVKNHGFQTAEDFKTIKCNYKQFESNYALLDGLDDQCIVSTYFNWKDSVKTQKNFSMLWTNQTHYPYFTHDKKTYTENPELNSYLNALKNDDEAFGRLMDGLKKRNILKNTLVVVVGDHGEAFGTHDQYSHALKIYEENMHVPCLLINPQLFKGVEDNRIGGLIDIAPTVMHLLNFKAPVEWQGISLLSTKQKTHTFFIGPFSDFMFGSRFGNWKFIYNTVLNESELYDLKSDPKELNNVAHKYPEIVKREYEVLGGWVQYHNAKTKSWVK